MKLSVRLSAGYLVSGQSARADRMEQRPFLWDHFLKDVTLIFLFDPARSCRGSFENYFSVGGEYVDY